VNQQVERRSSRGTRRITVIGMALVAIVAAPVLVDARYDSFPLSTYPMFARDRGRVVSIPTVVAVDGEHTTRLSSELIGGTDEPMLAAESVVHAIRDGDATSLCAEVAVRAAGRARGVLQVVTETYDTMTWFDGERTPRGRTVHATCPVER
jgi:hypothetical protein